MRTGCAGPRDPWRLARAGDRVGPARARSPRHPDSDLAGRSAERHRGAWTVRTGDWPTRREDRSAFIQNVELVRDAEGVIQEVERAARPTKLMHRVRHTITAAV